MDETDFLTRLQGYGQALRNGAESITRLLGLIQLKTATEAVSHGGGGLTAGT